MGKNLRIGVDLLGSDTPTQELFEGAVSAALELPSSFHLVCFCKKGQSEFLRKACPSKLTSKISFIFVSQEIEMKDPPLYAIRRKRDSSLCLGISQLKNKEIDVFVTAGNTGALTAYSTLELNRLKGIERPALLTILPSQLKRMTVLDVGANVNPKTEHLLQYAQMGAAFQKIAYNVEKPNVALLNIGSEAMKGTLIAQKAYQVISDFCESSLNQHLKMQFKGNYEAQRVFSGEIDVLVTDGFSGNIFLKTCEGVTSFILNHLEKNYFHQFSPSKKTILSALNTFLNYAEYPGAILAGVDQLVIKCHGYSSPKAMYTGILGAAALVQKQLLKKMSEYFL